MTSKTKQPIALREELKKYIYVENYEKAKGLVTQIETKIVEFLNEKDINEKFLILNILAKYYRKIKNYDKSANYSRQAIRIAKQVNKDHMKVIVDTFLNYAALEREYGQPSNARIELANLLALLDKNNYRDDFSYGLIFSSLGKVALDEENMESGLKQLEKALSYFQKSVPQSHPVIAQTIHTLSDVYIQVENYHKALELQQQLLEVYQKQEDSVQEGQQLLKIGEIYFYIDLKKARRIITKAIKLFEKNYEGKHVDIAKANLMLAELDESMLNLPRAITYYKRALEQLQGFYSESHFLVVYAYSKIGTISIKANELEQAKAYLERGLDLSEDFPKIRLQFLYALGKIYSGEKQYTLAFDVFQEFLERLDKEGRKKSLAYGNTLQAIAFNYLEQEKVDDACTYYEQALEIYEEVANCKEEKGLTFIRLAYCYENKQEKDLDKAEQFYAKGFKLIERARNKDLLEEALAGVIDFFTRNDNPKKRRIYEDKFVKLQTSKTKNN